jgi:hypothetical protein
MQAAISNAPFSLCLSMRQSIGEQTTKVNPMILSYGTDWPGGKFVLLELLAAFR